MSHEARGVLVALVAILLFVAGIGQGVSGTPLEGFGTTTLGGSAGAVVHVTTLADKGPGSLREAVRRGNRTVVFDVAGDITLKDHVYVLGPNVTIDATTAPAPGITLRKRGLIIRGNKGAHDVIVRGIRVRDSNIDGIQVAYGAFNVVLDLVSVSGSLDGDIDITDSHDVTVSWSILGPNGKNVLVKYGSSRITLHHVAFVNSLTRNPQVAVDDPGSPATGLVADVRNNVVTGWGSGYGTLVWKGAQANVVNNYYAISRDALTVTGARAYVSGNVSGDGVNINKGGTEPQPFPSAAVTTQDTCTAAWAVLGGAGVRPLDAVDQKLLDSVTLACAAPPSPAPPAPAPLAVTFDTTVSASTPPLSQTTSVKIRAPEWEARIEIEENGHDGPADWLRVTPRSGKGPVATFEVAASSSGLEEGLRKGKITVIGKGTSQRQVVPVTLAIDPAGLPAGIYQTRIATGADNGAENPGGIVQLFKRSLRIGGKSLVALRFTNLQVPPGALVESAVLQMFALEGESARASVRYQGEATGNSAPFNALSALSARTRTTAFVDQVLRRWKDGDYQPSADLTSIVQEIVSRSDWAAGNALTFFITGGPPMTSGDDDDDEEEEDKGDDGGDGQNERGIGSFETRPTSTRAAVLTFGFRMP